MCWGKGIWFYCHSDHCYHYPAHSYYLWENGGRVVRMLTWHLESWKKSIWVLEKSWKKSLKFVSEKGYGPSRSWARQSLSLSLSPLSEWYWVQVSQQQNLMKCWRRGGGVTYGGQTSCPGGWEGAILLVASCCRNWEKLWLLCELMLYV